jgi:hypothetical protein
MTTEDRALRFVLAGAPSVAGQRGHDRAFAVASALVHGFGLDRDRALSVMRAWNSSRANPPWSERELAHKIDSAIAAASKFSRGYLLHEEGTRRPSQGEGVAPMPTAPDRPRIPTYDAAKAERFASSCRLPLTLDYLAKRSPVPVTPPNDQNAATAQAFLDALYRPGENVLVFSDFKSQGDFLWTVGAGGFRLSRQRHVAPVPSRLPTVAPEGVWFLIQPVTGKWEIQGTGDGPRYGRRHGACVTAWRYLLLESDAAPESVWVRSIVQMPLRIAAIYTSGGRSVHALVRVDADSKADYDAARDVIRNVLPIFGADPAAMTGVRLSRLPGCRRGDRLQRLVWLDPDPPEIPILDRLAP